MRYAILASSLVLAACGRSSIQPIPAPPEVAVPIPARCTDGERPEQPIALRDRVPDEVWVRLTPSQRQGHILAQAERWRRHAEDVAGWAAGCG